MSADTIAELETLRAECARLSALNKQATVKELKAWRQVSQFTTQLLEARLRIKKLEDLILFGLYDHVNRERLAIQERRAAEKTGRSDKAEQ